MTVAGTPLVLQLLFSRGVPRPLSELATGSCAVISEDHTISVYDSSSPDWMLTANARWPEEIVLTSQPWAALAPTAPAGVVLLNMAVCDVRALPAEVRMSLEMQHQRYAPLPASSPDLAPRFRVTVDPGQVRITAGPANTRVLAIGAPYTVTADAYRRHEVMTFSYLSPSLRLVARAISQFGPISTGDLLHRIYTAPSAQNKSALHVTLSRLRRNPQIHLSRLEDGRLTISNRAGSADIPDQLAPSSAG
jgi:hypothetical protein